MGDEEFAEHLYTGAPGPDYHLTQFFGDGSLSEPHLCDFDYAKAAQWTENQILQIIDELNLKHDQFEANIADMLSAEESVTQNDPKISYWSKAIEEIEQVVYTLGLIVHYKNNPGELKKDMVSHD